MTTFIFICGGLLLLSGLFYLFPRKREGGADEDLARANLEWFRLRQAELAREGGDNLQDDTRLRLLEDEQQQHARASAAAVGSQFPLWVLLPSVAIASIAMYYALGAAPDVMISQQLRSVDPESAPEQMEALISSIEVRSAQRPDNLHYVALLGRYYMAQQDYARAALSYGALADDSPQDAQALAYAAQAQYMSSGRELSAQARMNAEQALAIDPHQRTALGLLGMASFEQGQYRAAIEYWERLLAMEAPGSESAQMIGGVIASARQKLGDDESTGTEVAQAQPAITGAGVTVRVALPEGAQVSRSDTVFILARNAASDSRMPIAVKRLQGSQLPVTLRLDDSNSMAGQKLSQTASVLVVVQVSPDGRPGEGSATWLGQAGPLAPSDDPEPLDIVLSPKS